MSGPIATAVSAIFGLEASVASFVASIVTGTISGGIQVHDESGLLGRGTGGIVSLAPFLASVHHWVQPEMTNAAAEQRAPLCRR